MSLTPSGVVRVGDAAAIASDAARSAVRPLGVIDELRIRECGREECTRILVGRSRSGNRHWCGPEECGNRVKAAYYRFRKKSRTSSAG
ncbi:CGNR zinc finger domain-containing protein [Microbispora sp. NBRC 16548]|uniref:CGNR zinc finger domain-containing protein n=1 Tax=Microbispora sp. NBRC 16548 TaxID=3030994 RepID=UPI0016145142|nr:CGNR zinc finger domain-containing protein [Microbispora sp. NBRC 16548]GLX11472.1 hypothetical protein Misp03_83980 [Microbispora sp. NBRC 16548]